MEFSEKVFFCDHLLAENKIDLPAGELFQVSELSLIRGGEMAEHIQYCDEITYAISGSALFYSDEQCNEVKSGQIHYIKKGTYHRIVVNPETNFRYICIGFIADREGCTVYNSYFPLNAKGQFGVQIVGLAAETDYYTRVFAIYGEGEDAVTVYSDAKEFTLGN